MLMKLILFALLIAAYPAYAKTCTEDNTSDCIGLGYTETSKECAYGGVICPFNEHYWKCSDWTCSDGRYYDQEQPDRICIAVTYKGLNCFDCYSGCMSDEVDYEACWEGNLLTAVYECDTQGYKDSPTSCSNYISCPSDFTKVRCID